jgi:hypothetical protein
MRENSESGAYHLKIFKSLYYIDLPRYTCKGVDGKSALDAGFSPSFAARLAVFRAGKVLSPAKNRLMSGIYRLRG